MGPDPAVTHRINAGKGNAERGVQPSHEQGCVQSLDLLHLGDEYMQSDFSNALQTETSNSLQGENVHSVRIV